jgi:hypothetical protein
MENPGLARIEYEVVSSRLMPIMQYFCRKSFISHWIALSDGPVCLFAFEILRGLGIGKTDYFS